MMSHTGTQTVIINILPDISKKAISKKICFILQ